MCVALTAGALAVAGCSSNPYEINGIVYGSNGTFTIPVKDGALNFTGERVPMVRDLPRNCQAAAQLEAGASGCQIILVANGDIDVFRYTAPGSAGQKLIAVGPIAPPMSSGGGMPDSSKRSG